MRRFFFEPENRQGDEVVFSAEQARHAVRVLRLQSGARLELFDGQGTVYHATLSVIDGRVAARLEGVAAYAEEGGVALWVAQGMLRGEKMDHVVQKCTELGVNRFSPLESLRCQGRLNTEQGRKKLARWRRIALEACKQCLRPLPMQLEPPQSWQGFLDQSPQQGDDLLRLVCWEEEKEYRLHHLPDLARFSGVLLLLGPEGGLSREEVAAAQDAGFRTVSLGDRVLRAETATLASVAVIQYLTGGI